MDHVYLILFEKHHKYPCCIKAFSVMIDRQCPNLLGVCVCGGGVSLVS